MRVFPFQKLDAFASQGSAGNPAGAIYLNADEAVSDAEMQQIAREMAGFVSEVGFVWPIDDSGLALRYYSAEREVAFCGHATIAILYDLCQTRDELRERPNVQIVTSKGQLTVENWLKEEDAVYVSSPKPQFSSATFDGGALAQALGVTEQDVADDWPVSLVNAGLETLVVPTSGLDVTLALTPDMAVLRRYCQEQGIDIILVCSRETADPSHDYRSRVFAPTFGYLEDPATGSGNAALGHYLLVNGYWDGSPLMIEQNGLRDEPNIVRLRGARDRFANSHVSFGGGAVVRIRGEYLLA